MIEKYFGELINIEQMRNLYHEAIKLGMPFGRGS